MTVPYNLFPMETLFPMMEAEGANAPALLDAAKMWTQVREWVGETQTLLNTRAGELSPQWTDEAGRAHEEKIQRTLAELKMWGERLDAAQVPATLTTLAADVQATQAIVTGLHASYTAVAYNPLTAAAALPLQQAAATKMTELGGNFDMSMLKVVSGAGLETPGDVLPSAPGGNASAEGNSPADFIKAATSGVSFASAGLDDLQDLQSLGSALGGSGDAGSALPPAHSGGLSLAGLSPDLPAALSAAGGSLGPLPGPGAGGAPAVSGLPGLAGASTAASLLPAARPVTGKRAPGLAGEVQAGWAETPAAAAAPGAAGPMMPGLGQGMSSGTLRPGSSESPTGRSGSARKPAKRTEGVPSALRGRAGAGDPAGFTLSARRRPDESGPPLDEDLWSATH